MLDPVPLPDVLRPAGHPPTLLRAVAFLDGHPTLDVAVPDIARAAHVTPRALQLVFRRHLGTTPLLHLRRVRLDRAYTELLAARPGDGTTVTSVSSRWGFSHPGRFVGWYREAYGELPSATLRR